MQDRLREDTSASLNTTIGTANDFGDAQLAVDVEAERLLFSALAGKCAVCSSEESPVLKDAGGANLCLVFDPLDGSSIVGSNMAVGTIFGIYPGATLTGTTGRQQLAAGYALYGPRTDFVVALAQPSALLRATRAPLSQILLRRCHACDGGTAQRFCHALLVSFVAACSARAAHMLVPQGHSIAACSSMGNNT